MVSVSPSLNLEHKASNNVQNIIIKNFEIAETDLIKPNFLIIYDLNSALSKILFKAYYELLPQAIPINFYENDPEAIKARLKEFKAGDLVVLIQSTSFRMSNFRWRLELFNLGFQVIEHAHLGVNKEEESTNYIDTLAYQGNFYQKAADYLKPLIENCKKIVVECVGGTQLIYEGGMEEVKKNIGNFSEIKNRGCGFPIGEVFSEPRNFESVNGEVTIYAFANKEHRVIFPEKPFLMKVEHGCVYPIDAPKEFMEIIDLIKTENEDGLVRVREFGLGLNKGITKTKRLTDISAYERVCGMHMSLGMKHDIYRKKIAAKKVQRFHIDIFPDIEKIIVDGITIFENSDYRLK